MVSRLEASEKSQSSRPKLLPTLSKEEVKKTLKPENDKTSEQRPVNVYPALGDEPKQAEVIAAAWLREELGQIVRDIDCGLFYARDARLRKWTALNSREFELYIKNYGKRVLMSFPTKNVVKEVVEILEATASEAAPKKRIRRRIAHEGNQIFVDLCDEAHSVVEICPGQVSIKRASDLDICFSSSKTAAPLPVPILGRERPSEKLARLRQLLNAADDSVWTLVVAFLLSCYSGGPYFALIVTGEQGSAKSWMCEIIRLLVDPSGAGRVIAPKEVRDLFIRAQNSLLVTLENVSFLTQEFSDAICTISTGGSYVERKFHTNNGEEAVLKAQCPVMLNGIGLSIKGDLQDRALIINLGRINPLDRREESELRAQFEKDKGIIFGGLLEVVASALEQLPHTSLKEKPRMADASRFITAAEYALGWPAGQFMETFRKSAQLGVEAVLDSDPFGAALHELLTERGFYSGSWAELLGELNPEGRSKVGWPDTPKALAIRLDRLAPALRAVGVTFEHTNNSSKRGYRFSLSANQAEPKRLPSGLFSKSKPAPDAKTPVVVPAKPDHKQRRIDEWALEGEI